MKLNELAKVADLARVYMESQERDTRSVNDIMNAMASGTFTPDPNYVVLCDYLDGLDYETILGIEAALIFGRELIYDDDPTSYTECLEYVQTEWGGDRGNKELAIEYITGKVQALPEYLDAAISEIDLEVNA